MYYTTNLEWKLVLQLGRTMYTYTFHMLSSSGVTTRRSAKRLPKTPNPGFTPIPAFPQYQ